MGIVAQRDHAPSEAGVAQGTHPQAAAVVDRRLERNARYEDAIGAIGSIALAYIQTQRLAGSLYNLHQLHRMPAIGLVHQLVRRIHRLFAAHGAWLQDAHNHLTTTFHSLQGGCRIRIVIIFNSFYLPKDLGADAANLAEVALQQYGILDAATAGVAAALIALLLLVAVLLLLAVLLLIGLVMLLLLLVAQAGELIGGQRSGRCASRTGSNIRN